MNHKPIVIALLCLIIMSAIVVGAVMMQKSPVPSAQLHSLNTTPAVSTSPVPAASDSADATAVSASAAVNPLDTINPFKTNDENPFQ